MKTALLIAAMMFAPIACGADHMIEGDNYVESDDGQIVLFSLPGCEMGGKKGLFGHAIWKTGVSEIVCWQYDNVIYIYAPERTIIFDPSEVRTRGVNANRGAAYSSLLHNRYGKRERLFCSAPQAAHPGSVAPSCQPVWVPA